MKMQCYANTVGKLDEWIKDYIKNVCISLEPDVIKLYVEKDSDPVADEALYDKHRLENVKAELVWGFFVKKTMGKEGLDVILDIYLEILEKKLPSEMALEEYKEILEYVKEDVEALKKHLFREIEGDRMSQRYVERVMKELPDKEIFVELSALNYENRVTHTHLVFDTNLSFSEEWDNSIFFDAPMAFDIKKIRLIRKLMEISGETFGLIIQKDLSQGQGFEEWYIKGAAPLEKLKDYYQVEMVGHSIWIFKHGDEQLFRYKEGVYKLPFIGSEKSEYEKEYEKLDPIVHDWEQLKNIKSTLTRIRKVASHGTGIIFMEDSLLSEQIERLAGLEKAYALKKPLNLLGATSEVLKGITAIDGAIFCNFNLECKAIGVIVDGETVSKGDPGKGARHNSLSNYVNWLKKDDKNNDKDCVAVVMSEDGPITIVVGQKK